MAQDSLREPNKLKPWLVRILVNECHEVLRRRKREIAPENLPEESAPPPQEQRELRELVMSLPENERLPIVLHYLEGFRHRRSRPRCAAQGHHSFAHEPRPQAIKTLPDGGMKDEKLGFSIWRSAGELFPARP